MKFYIFDETVFSTFKTIRNIRERILLLDVIVNNIFQNPHSSNHGSAYELDFRSIYGLSAENKILFKILFTKCKSIADTTSKTVNQKVFEMLLDLDEEIRYKILWSLAKLYFTGSNLTKLNSLEQLFFNEIKKQFDIVILHHEKIVKRAKKAANARWGKKDDSAKVIHHEMLTDASSMPNDMHTNASQCQGGFPLIKVSTPSKLNSSYEEGVVILYASKKTKFPNFERFCKLYPGRKRNRIEALQLWNTLHLESDDKFSVFLTQLRADIASTPLGKMANIADYLKNLPTNFENDRLVINPILLGQWLPDLDSEDKNYD